MKSMEELEKSIHGVEDLQSIVKTMKALATTSISQYQKAVESLEEYKHTINMGMQVVLKKSKYGYKYKPSDGEFKIHIVFGSDQGLAGRFNDNILEFLYDHTGEELLGSENNLMFCVGQQALSRLEENNKEIQELFTLPYTIDGITNKVQEILLKIDEWKDRLRDAPQVILYYNRPLSGARYTPHKTKLMPPDIASIYGRNKEWPSRCIPTYTMDTDKLFSALLKQHLFITVYRAFGLSLAAENASRLASMQAAEKNIDERLEDLRGQFRRKRQNSITEELNDIVSGFKALSKGKN